MTIRRGIVSMEDFGGEDNLTQYSSLSPLDCLAIVAQKAIENEKFQSSLSLDIPMVEQQGTPINMMPIKKRKQREIPKTGPRPGTPMAMLEDDQETAIEAEKRNGPHSNPVGAHVPVLPQEFKDRIFTLGGSDPTMVIQKRLFKCDTHKGQGRLTMPERGCGRLHLTKEERELLEARDEKNKLVGIRVKLIDPGLKERELSFRNWNYKKSANFVFVNNWNEVVAKNHLETGDEIQVWAFRVQGELAFALVKLQSSSNGGGRYPGVDPKSLNWGAKRRRT